MAEKSGVRSQESEEMITDNQVFPIPYFLPSPIFLYSLTESH